ncbi:MAG: DUF2330 domain-containing protein [Azonexus sp.]
MKRLATALGIALASATAQAFCGFYVGKADANLFNEASQVIVVRDGDKTVVSMLNDFKGDLKEFAVVVPVPTVLQKGQVHVGEKKLFDRLDAYSAPRLAEYYDPNPCDRRLYERMRKDMAMVAAPASAAAPAPAKALGVTVEASFSVGEYDIVILSATQSDGLETWLTQSGYRIPKNAAKALAPYIRQNMKFFVAKVNLAEQAKTGFQMLRPLQFAYESEKFMLPIRLGMANASGPQDLIAYMLTRNGRVETTNYRTVKLPANMDLPVFLKQGDEFRNFYKAMFGEQAKKEGYRVAFTEYFWDMSWCDPCAADPLSPEELRQAGVFWMVPPNPGSAAPAPSILPRGPIPGGGAQPVMLTRMHIRYTPETFPEDLMFQETKDRQNFQTRYVLRHPAKVAPEACPEAKAYLEGVARRQEQEAQQLASLTGGDIDAIRRKLDLPPAPTQRPWWEGLWK